ncbi:MAG: ligase-associated DNA damage response endonuclease PdeM [Flavisolibacter sp.]
MQAPTLHKILEQKLWLSPQRSIYWENEKALILSDLHFGKTGHFRKYGIAVPQHVYQEDLQRLINLLHYFKPDQLIVVGDFFHSHQNTELEWFRKWRSAFDATQITLVKGNHDILEASWYTKAGINLIKEELKIKGFLFKHDYCSVDTDYYTFCGHIHPGILVHGLGKQTLRFPCFHFSQYHCILPAFSKFTGLALVHPDHKDSLYAVVDNSLIQMQ